uniref:Uncharacterized protein n=1 Tax=Arundo donax TaxID=35708 RepID=A0A0A9ECF6_ARUDO
MKTEVNVSSAHDDLPGAGSQLLPLFLLPLPYSDSAARSSSTHAGNCLQRSVEKPVDEADGDLQLFSATAATGQEMRGCHPTGLCVS